MLDSNKKSPEQKTESNEIILNQINEENKKRNVKKILIGVGLGAFVFFFKLLAGRELDSTLPNFALQVGIVALMVFLWRWEQK